MEHARPPAELSLEGGPASRADAWQRWRKQFQIFLKASGVHKEPADVQASLLINLIGPEGYDIYSTFKFTKEIEKDDIQILITKFDDYFKIKQNTTMARFKFFSRNQEKGENIDDYVTALKLLTQQCEFEHLEDGLIRDCIVCGAVESCVRDRLLRSDDLTLENAVKICQANEMSNEESKQIEVSKASGSGDAGASTAAVDVVYGRGSGGGGAGRWRAQGGRTPGVGRPLGGRAPIMDHEGDACAKCGGYRCLGGARCPARTVQCSFCFERGHFRKVCPRRQHKKVYELHEEDDDEDSENDL